MMPVRGQPRASRGRVLFEGRGITHLPTHETKRLGLTISPEGRRVSPTARRWTTIKHDRIRSACVRAECTRGQWPGSDAQTH